MRIQWLLASRYLKGRMQRSILTTLAIVLGVAILFGMNALLPPVIESFRHSMYTSADTVDITISSVSNSTFDHTTLDEVRTMDGISYANGYLSKNVVLPASLGGSSKTGTGVNSITLTGVDAEAIQSTHVYSLESGRFLDASDGYAAVIAQSLATSLRLKVGDEMVLPSSKGTARLTLVGILNNTSPDAATQVLTPLATAQEILNLPGQINTIDILLTSSADKAAVESALVAKLGDAYKVGAVQTGEELLAMLGLGKSIMWFFGIAALAMAAFIIFNTFRTLVAERKRDLGMLRALGANQRTLMGMILTESVLQGIIGTALGVVLGGLFAAGLLKALASLLREFIHTTVSGPIFTVGNFIAAIVLGVGFTVASAYFPARSTMKVTPMEALRPALGAPEQHKYRIRAWIGLALCAAGLAGLLIDGDTFLAIGLLLFLVGLILVTPALVKPVAVGFSWLYSLLFKRESMLARENLIRQPGRAAITASAMMIGLALCVAMLGMITSIWSGFMGYLDKSLGSDYIMLPTSLVLGGGNLGADPALAAEVSRVDGVSAVTTLRQATSQIDGASLQVIGIDPETYPQVAGLEFTQGDATSAYADLASGRALIVNAIFSSTYNIHPGDRVTLKTSLGDKPYDVVGVGMDYLNAKIATAYISQANLATDFNSTNDVLLLIDHTPTADVTQVTDDLQTLANAYPAFTLYDVTSFKTSQQQLFTMAISAMYVLVLMMAIPGLIAMANTMSINVIERTREIGMLRAVGSTRPQVQRMILEESLLLSTLGTLLGIATGLFLSDFIVKALSFAAFKLDFYFPTAGVILAIVVGLAFGILAAVAPARKAARTVIVEALRYE
jgi:putative ABC transport system permease protein